MYLKRELESWKAVAASYGHEIVSTSETSWRMDLGEDLFVKLRVYHEPDEMALSGSSLCIEWLQQIFHCAMVDRETILLAKEHIASRIELLCEHQLRNGEQKLELDPLLMEGGVRQMQTTKHERNPELRKACVANWQELHNGRVSCAACDMSFAERYGEIGDGYIEVHHLLPISQAGDMHMVDPKKDLVPLCANCHAMIHRLMVKWKECNEVELEGIMALEKLKNCLKTC